MISNRSIASLFVISLLAAALVPAAAAREPLALDDGATVRDAAPAEPPAPELVAPAPPALDAAAALPCLDACAAPAATTHQPLTVVAPTAGAGSQPDGPVTIVWKADVYDMVRSGKLFKVQAKSQDPGAAWTDVTPYTCFQAEDDVFPSGTCKATWTPAAGIYALRVILLSSPLDDSICSLGVNCQLVTPYFVDGQPIALEGLCLVVTECIPTATTLTSAIQLATVGAVDDLAISILSVSATNPDDESVSCGLFDASENADSGPVTEVAPGTLTCELDLRPILDHPTEDAYVGTVTLSATGIDAAGNVVTITDGTYTVDTSPKPIAATALVGTPPSLVPNGESVTLTFRTTYAAPVSLIGKPVKNQPFTVTDGLGATVCTGTTGINGVTQCAVSGTDAVRVLTGGVTPSATLDAVPKSVSITWTSLVLQRAATEDAPRTSLFANPEEVYAPAYRVSYSHDGSPVGGAVVSLAPPGGDASFETTDATGFVRVPVVSDVTAVLTFAADVAAAPLAATGPDVTVTWSRLVVTPGGVDDGFVNVGDDVTLTGTVAYEHDLSVPVESATLAVGADAPEGCTLSSGGVTDGDLTAVVACAGVNVAPVPVVVADSARGITALSAPLAVAATWTHLVVSSLSTPDDFVSVGDAVAMTGVVTYAHDGSPVPSATLALADGAPTGCVLGAAGVTLGNLALDVTCDAVQDLSADGLGLEVASASQGVTRLAQPLVLQAIWTSITVTGLGVDDGFVNVGDDVTLTGTAAYAHDGSAVPAATLALGADAPAGCAIGSGSITDGALSAVVACDAVQDASVTGIPLVVASATDDVTALTSALAANAVWTNIAIAGLSLDDAFVDVGDAITLTGVATWAHDGAPVPEATLAFGTGVPETCTLDEQGIAAGELTATVTCTDVGDFSATGIPLVVTSATDGVTQLASPLTLDAVWTRIVLSELDVDDSLVNVGDAVTLTGTAAYAHDGSAVPAATLAFGEGAAAACGVSSGSIVAGALSVSVTCSDVVDASAAGLPLVVSTSDDGVTQLSAPLALQAIWTKVKVTYVTDTSRKLLEPGAPVVFTATVTFAHNDAPVENAAAIVKSRTPGDTDEFVCLTDATGMCVVEVTKTAGEFTFDVTAFSTTLGTDGRLVPDITAMVDTPAPATYRWTAIAFEAFECVANGVTSACHGEEFGVATPVLVRVRAVAADTGAALAGVEIKLGGQTMTTNGDGEASRTVTRFSVGGVTVTARGVSWTVDGETVTWTMPRSETLLFA